jgi:hypothetical protein
MKTVRDEEFRSYVLARRAEMVRTATLLTAGDRHLAEDLVQSTLTQLYLACIGKQPSGYTLDKVPAGWEINSNDTDVLLLAPVGFTEEPAPAPAEGEAPAPAPGVSLEGKIAVMQQGAASFPSGIRMDKVQVGERPGVIAHMKGAGDTRTLFVKQPSGDYLTIQVWSGLGWSNDRIVEFGAGVHVTKDATVGQG